MKAATILAVLFTFLISSNLALNISYTDPSPNKKLCMTECVLNSAQTLHYCYTGWGNEWYYCTPGIIPAVQYKTSLAQQRTEVACSSMCGLFGDAGGKTWCYLNGDEGSGRWDYCSVDGFVTVTGKQCESPCAPNPDDTSTSQYICLVGGNFENCSPVPDSAAMNEALTGIMRKKEGVYLAFLKFVKWAECYDPHPRSALRQARVDEEDQIRDYGVLQFADVLELTYPNQLYPNDPANPITAVTWEQAPHRAGLNDIQLTHVIRATIRPNHLQRRTAIPAWVTTRMADMDYIRGTDERGHLLAASFGGPTVWYNFAPQTNTVNRNVGYAGQRTSGSWWYMIEGEIRNFLVRPNAGYVDWVLVLTYGDLAVTRRPTGFGLVLHRYDNNGNFIDTSGDMFFDNDPNAPNSVC